MLVRRATSGLLVALLTSLGTGVTATPADAAVRSESGKRCTVVGTAGDDRLVGTSGRDVICGRGGDDTLLGRGGQDELDGGSGTDRLVGDGGSDRLLGGPGADTGSGGDGSDVLVGGEGGDVLTGGPSDDELFGEDGNDDIEGGGGSDDIDGGDGTNWCIVDALDVALRCVYDETAPVAGEMRLNVPSVDVTNDDALVKVAVELTDDTGITSVQITVHDESTGSHARTGFASLRTGTIRNGWWVATLRIPRWIEPGDYEVDGYIRDRVRRTTHHTWYDPTLTVLDDNPDRSAPEVVALPTPLPEVVDVRDEAATFLMSAQVTDTVSGVDSIYFCVSRPLNGGYSNLPCEVPDLVSGTRLDGVWEAELTIPKGAVGGYWNVAIWVEDRAHPGLAHFWMGPDEYRVKTENGWPEPRYHELPGGAGRIEVLGTNDSNPPVLESLVATPHQIDTLPGPVTVELRISATDAEGIKSVGAHLRAQLEGPGTPDFWIDEFTLSSGTPQDGEWVTELTLPQGTPPGTYVFQAWVDDGFHWRSYVSASSPLAGQPNQEVMADDPVIVVVPHSPAGG